MSLQSTTISNFGENDSFVIFTLPSFISLHSMTFFKIFLKIVVFYYFRHFGWDPPMHHAIALSDFLYFSSKLFSTFVILVIFVGLWSQAHASWTMLMLHECHYTEQFFVLFIVFVIFVGVFEPSYALCHRTQYFLFIFLIKIAVSFSFKPFGPSHSPWHWTQQFFFCNFVRFVDHLRLIVTFRKFVIACNTQHIS